MEPALPLCHDAANRREKRRLGVSFFLDQDLGTLSAAEPSEGERTAGLDVRLAILRDCEKPASHPVHVPWFDI
jgi:hypothetical protein